MVNGGREEDYGSTEDNFGRIAELWSAYLEAKFNLNVALQPHEVAHMMMLFKMARLMQAPGHLDSIVDLIGYAICGGQVATSLYQPPEPVKESKIMRITATIKPLIVRYKKAGVTYSNYVNKATSKPVGNGPFEELRLEPGSEFEILDTDTLVSVTPA